MKFVVRSGLEPFDWGESKRKFVFDDFGIVPINNEKMSLLINKNFLIYSFDSMLSMNYYGKSKNDDDVRLIMVNNDQIKYARDLVHYLFDGMTMPPLSLSYLIVVMLGECY